jgi:hypothetical protein
MHVPDLVLISPSGFFWERDMLQGIVFVREIADAGGWLVKPVV